MEFEIGEIARVSSGSLIAKKIGTPLIRVTRLQNPESATWGGNSLLAWGSIVIEGRYKGAKLSATLAVRVPHLEQLALQA